MVCHRPPLLDHPVDDPLQRNDVRGLLRNEAKFRLNTRSAPSTYRLASILLTTHTYMIDSQRRALDICTLVSQYACIQDHVAFRYSISVSPPLGQPPIFVKWNILEW